MKNHKSWRRYIKMLCLVFPQGKQRNGNKLLCYFLLKKYIYFKSNNQLLPNHWVWVVKSWSQGRNGQSDILAVLVVIFADVAEVRCKGLNSQGTWDLPTFPLNDHTCHKHTYHKLRARPTAEKHETLKGHIFTTLLLLLLANDKGHKREEKKRSFTRGRLPRHN